MSAKKLYKGTFNFQGVNFNLYTHSKSKDSAFLNFINQLNKRLDVGKRTIMFAFNGSKDNYYIEEVKHDNYPRTPHKTD